MNQDPSISKIASTLLSLESISTVSVIIPPEGIPENDPHSIWIHCSRWQVPDLELRWCKEKSHFQVFIYVMSRENPVKINAGYCLFTIKSSLAASGLVTLYQFLYNHRADSAEEPIADNQQQDQVQK